jgi:hypothetical protein
MLGIERLVTVEDLDPEPYSQEHLADVGEIEAVAEVQRNFVVVVESLVGAVDSIVDHPDFEAVRSMVRASELAYHL